MNETRGVANVGFSARNAKASRDSAGVDQLLAGVLAGIE
jgi:hypothetical protein